MGLDSASEKSAAASLAPGFRFHPTDEELVWYYLKRKVCGMPFRFDAISEIDVYKFEPWDLPGKSRLKTRDLEWYFFGFLDKKYGKSSRTNRATERGYWKTTGKDRPVQHRSGTVGMKKTLVYHLGRAPRGERTNWVMHEYKLVGEEFEKNGKDGCILCRIFQKSGSGPKNGEQYGAPFIEEEWEDDELVTVPGQESAEEVAVCDDDVYVGDDVYLDDHDVEQILNVEIPPVNAPVPVGYHLEDNTNPIKDSADFVDDIQKFLVSMSENSCAPEQPDDQRIFDLPLQHDMDLKLVKHKYMGESSNFANPVEADQLLEEHFLDACDNFQFDDGSFLENNDLSNPVDVDPSGFDMLEEYLTYLNADEDFSPLMVSENLVSERASFVQEPVNGEFKQETLASQGLMEGHNNLVASSLEKVNSKMELVNDVKYPFFKQASRMLENIPAPPAFASEFPTKDVSLQLNSASPSSSSAHVTAGMIQIRNASLSGNGSYWSLGKQANVNIIISFDLSHNHTNSAALGKTGLVASRGWFYLLFVWLLIMALSFKIETYIYTGKA